MLFRFRSAAALFISLGLMIALLTITERILSFNAGPQSVHAQADSSRSTTMASAADPGFGPALFAVSLPDDESLSKLPPTMSLHTPLDRARNLYIASGGPDDLQILRDVGLSAVLLDASTDGQRYYLVDGQLAQISGLLSAGRKLLYDSDDTLLVSTGEAYEQTLVETLTKQGMRLSLVTADPLRFADSATIQAASFKPIDVADPFIDGLLTQLNTADLAAIIGDLSGENEVTIDGSTLVIDTRYTLSSRIDEPERYIFQAYAQMGIDAEYVDWSYGSFSGRNIVADLKGVVNPDRVWLIGGHFDSNSEIPYSSAPGADDNASGTAATLSIAAVLKQADLADTVRLIHFSGEEQGQWGSKQYVPALAGANEEIVGYIDIDMIGWDGNGDNVAELHTGTGEVSNLLGTAIIEAGTAYSLGLSFERKTTSASRFSDHSPFWDGGYPAVLAIENFYADDIPSDHSPWYHHSGDTLDRVDLDYVLAHARTALATIAELAGAAETIEVPTPMPTTTPEPATATPTATTTPTPQPAGCVELLANGGWEGDGGWRYGTTPFSAAVVLEPVHAGERALQQGIPESAANRLAHSSAFQEVLIPVDAETVSLGYWSRPGGSGDGVDFREVRLLDSNYGPLAQIDENRASGDDEWRQKTFDLSTYRGQTVVLYFNVYNDGNSSQLWTYIDGVSIIACLEAPSVATPTPTVTSTLTPSLTPTSTVTPTVPITVPTTPTATATASATVTFTPTLIVTAPVTVTITPTATLVPTATPTPASVIVSPTSVELDLHSGETQATITFDDAGISRPWKARALASWISMPVDHGATGEGMQFLINPPGLPRPTGMTQTATLTASSSISITFGAISDTVSVDVTISYNTFDLIFLPIISGRR